MISFFLYFPITVISVTQKSICLYNFVGGNWTVQHEGNTSYLFVYPNSDKINTNPVDETGFTPNITEFFGNFNGTDFTVSIQNNFSATITFSNLVFDVTLIQEDESASQAQVELSTGEIIQIIIPFIFPLVFLISSTKSSKFKNVKNSSSKVFLSIQLLKNKSFQLLFIPFSKFL